MNAIIPGVNKPGAYAPGKWLKDVYVLLLRLSLLLLIVIIKGIVDFIRHAVFRFLKVFLCFGFLLLKLSFQFL